MRVKFFTRTYNNGTSKNNDQLELEDQINRWNDQLELEDQINRWLEQNVTVQVVDIKQSISVDRYSKSQFFITILYEP